MCFVENQVEAMYISSQTYQMLIQPTLLPYIYKSYDYLIFNGDGNPNGDKAKTTFRPYDLITVDELSAILTRLVKNHTMEEPAEDRARNYRNYLGSIASNSALKNDIR